MTEVSHISQLDHFIYAAKFKPFFPLVMIVSFIYIVVMTAHFLLQKNDYKKLTFFYSRFSTLFFVIASFFIKSVTIGGTLFCYLFALLGVVHFLMAFRTGQK